MQPVQQYLRQPATRIHVPAEPIVQDRSECHEPRSQLLQGELVRCIPQRERLCHRPVMFMGH